MMSQLRFQARRSSGGQRHAVPVLVLLILAGLSGCAFLNQPMLGGVQLSVTAPIRIPPGRAHAILQGGRLAHYSNKLEPYCELEVKRVSGDEGQRLTSGEFQIGRVSSQLLLDPTTRIPALLMGSSCSDPLFQESVWWLRPAQSSPNQSSPNQSSPNQSSPSQSSPNQSSPVEPSEVMFLRCIAPYYNCTLGPPLSVEQVRQQVGGYLDIRFSAPTPGQNH